jgi:hypothetical protein
MCGIPQPSTTTIKFDGLIVLKSKRPCKGRPEQLKKNKVRDAGNKYGYLAASLHSNISTKIMVSG